MSDYIEKIEPENLDLTKVSRSDLIEAAEDISATLSITVPFNPEESMENQALWYSEAVDLIQPEDVLHDETWEILEALGYNIPVEEEEEGLPDADWEEEAPVEEKASEKKVKKAAKKSKKQEGDEEVTEQKPVTTKKKEKKLRTAKASKEAKVKEAKEKKPGVILSIYNYAIAHMEEGFTINQCHDHIVELFPEKNPVSLLATCRVQLQNSRMGKERRLAFSRKKKEDGDILIFGRYLAEGEEPILSDRTLKAQEKEENAARKAAEKKARQEAKEAKEKERAEKKAALEKAKADHAAERAEKARIKAERAEERARAKEAKALEEAAKEANAGEVKVRKAKAVEAEAEVQAE